MCRMKTYSMLSFDRITNLDLLLGGRQLSFKFDILLPERSHRLFELLARLLQLYDELSRVLVSVLQKKCPQVRQ